jgi:AraC-like DNA-binding protein
MQMLPQRLDTTLAFKAISLSEMLTSTEKQVAAAIIDSFNRRTHQCDPSFDRIAHLVGKSRRTVIRAVQRLQGLRFLVKVRHGGHAHRNSYEPNWPHFRQLEGNGRPGWPRGIGGQTCHLQWCQYRVTMVVTRLAPKPF